MHWLIGLYYQLSPYIFESLVLQANYLVRFGLTIRNAVCIQKQTEANASDKSLTSLREPHAKVPLWHKPC